MILITGATGYVGSHLAQRLAETGERPRCLVRDLDKSARVLPVEKLEIVQGDTTRIDSLEPAVKGIDTIVHCAFITADRKQLGPDFYDATNVQGTANLVQVAQAAGVKRVIEIGGLGTKPDRPGSYMQGRYAAELLLSQSTLEWTIIRPSVLFGKDAPFIKGLVELIRSAPVVPLIGGGGMKFQPIYVEDVVSVIIEVLREPERTTNKIYTIGGPAYYTFAQILAELLKATHKRRPRVYAPKALVGLAAALMEAVLPNPPLTKAAMTLFTFDNVTDLDSVERDFGFRPMSFSAYLTANGV
ncbi:SDR family oxidoreductase [Ktedonosporobacter rubrisoli]|nr:NAD(P)H-binding protein [Ktedonosporobacter rubrisoli]